MIYNLVAYLETQLPTERIYPNERFFMSGENVIPDRNILVRESGGSITEWSKFVRHTVQVVTRDSDPTQAKDMSEDVYSAIHRTYGLILPAVTVGAKVYPALITAQITAIQKPYPLGVDEEGRTEYVNNYEIYYTEN
jgi:hypothetical protein